MTTVEADGTTWGLVDGVVWLRGEWDLATEPVLAELVAFLVDREAATMDLRLVQFMDVKTLATLRCLPDVDFVNVPACVQRVLRVLSEGS